MATHAGQSPEIQPKREAILRAATSLFSRYGFRKTSIDQLAQEAQVAKPTVYAYFKDKDELFAAVCEHVMAEVLAAAQQASQSELPVAERLAAMLSAKFTTVFGLVDSSPHARELLESPNAAARAAIEAADARFIELMTKEVRAAAKAGELELSVLASSAKELVQLLMQAAHGAGYKVTTVDEHRHAVQRLVRAVLLSGLPRGSARSA